MEKDTQIVTIVCMLAASFIMKRKGSKQWKAFFFGAIGFIAVEVYRYISDNGH